jgi:iron complex outermembrane receptor protein
VKYVLLFLFFLSLALASIACAEPSGVPYRLDDVVVTASRTASPIREAPANITVVTKADIEETGAKTVSEALQYEVGLLTTNLLNNPKTSTVDIRGYGATADQNVLILVDGRRLNAPDLSSMDFSQVPIEMIERIEVYRGPVSVLFGDNAVAGAINIITRKGAGKPVVTAGMTTGSYNLYAPSLSVSGGDKMFSYYALGATYDTDGFRHNNGYHSRDALGNFSFQPLKNLSFNVRTGHHTDRSGLPGGLPLNDLRRGIFGRNDTAFPTNNSRTEDNFVELGTDIKLRDGMSLSIYGSHRDRNLSSHFDIAQSDGTIVPWETRRTIRTYGFTPRFLAENEWGSVRNTLTVGFDHYRSPLDSNDRYGTWPSTTSVEKREYGLYANNDMTILKRLVLGFGYRVDKAHYDFDYSEPGTASTGRSSYERDAFRASANYLFKNGNLFLTYAKGFRFATTEELSTGGAPPKDIRPQTAYEVDLGMRWNPDPNVGGSITLFRTRTDDEIYFNPVLYENGNYDRTRREGIEAALALTLTKALKWDISYTYLKAVFQQGMFDGNAVPLVPRNKVSSKLAYFYRDFIFTLTGLYVGNRYASGDVENSFQKVPGTVTFDFNVDYRYKQLALFLTAKNLTGRQYYDYAVVSGGTMWVYPSPERQFFLGVKYAFGG